MNGALAELITKHFPDQGALAEHYWRRSYTAGDANYQNQFWHARQLFVLGKTAEARDLFKTLSGAPVSAEAKLDVRGTLRDSNGHARQFNGQVLRLEDSYAWVSRDDDPTALFMHAANADPRVWQSLQPMSRITFEIGFNFRGPVAIKPSIAAI